MDDQRIDRESSRLGLLGLRWPQFSIVEMLAVFALLSTIWTIVAIRDREELLMTVIGSFVLVPVLYIWKMVRANAPRKK